MPSTSERLAEVPTAAADAATGIGAVVGNNLARAAVFVLLFLGVGFFPLGTGLLIVLFAVLSPALVAALALVVPPKVRSALADR
jgi:hypothetical protein